MDAMAPVIAIVGSDGSGKSTLAADILTHIRQTRRAEICYLGLGSGAMGNRIKQWPLIGPMLERALSKRADTARDKTASIPGLPTALVLYRFSLTRKARFEKLLAMRRAGITVVTDRYPQVDVPGFYDGPGLAAARAEGPVINMLARRERAIYDAMVAYRPTLVIRLNVGADTALSRKPDHDRALLERKVAVTPLLTFQGAPIVDLSSEEPYAMVLEKAKAAVDQALASA